MTSVVSFEDITLAVEYWLYSTGGIPRHYEITTLEAMGTSVDNSLALLKALYEIDAAAFPEQDRYKEKLWLLAIKDPQAFLIARDKRGKAVGYMSIFGFKKNSRFLRALEKKKAHTLDLPDLLDYYTDIVARDKWATEPIHIYIDAIAVKRRNRNQYPRAHLVLIARLIEDSKGWNTPIASISAIAVNEQGKSLCETLIRRRPKTINEVKEKISLCEKVQTQATHLICMVEYSCETRAGTPSRSREGSWVLFRISRRLRKGKRCLIGDQFPVPFWQLN